jgi:drug/metabolite transporter (DMT)-like permease
MTVPQIFAAATASQRGRHLTAIAAMTLAAFFWAVIELLGGLVPKRYSPVQTVWSRYLVHLLFMLIAFGPRQGRALVSTKCVGLQVSRALLMVGMPVCFILGATLLAFQIVWLLSWSSVAMMLVMARALLGERMAADMWVVCGIGWAGIWMMTGAGLPPISWRYLLPFGMGMCFASYVVMTRMMRLENSHAKLFHTALWVFLLLSLVLPLQWTMPSLRVCGVYIAIGLVGYLCLFLLDKSLELAPASLTAPMIFSVPIWSALLDYLVVGRRLVGISVLGVLIVITMFAYIVLAEWTGRRRLVAMDFATEIHRMRNEIAGTPPRTGGM